MTALRTRYRVTGILAPHSTTVLCHFRTTSQSGTHPVGPSQFAVHWMDRLRHGLGGPANSFPNSKSHSLAQSNAVPEPNPSSRAKNSAARNGLSASYSVFACSVDKSVSSCWWWPVVTVK